MELPGAPSPIAKLARVARSASVELLALAAAGAVVLLLRARGMRMGWQAIEFTLPPMLGSLPRILLTGVALHLLIAVFENRREQRRESWRERRSAMRNYLFGFLRPASLVGWLRICAAFMLATFAYTWLKVCVPLINPRLWDAELWRLDRWLHFGVSPNVFVLELFRGTPLLPALDLWYSFWIATVFLAWAWAAAHPDASVRRRFVFGCALLSIAGSWLYLAFPVLGPCYAFPDLFAGVGDQIPHAAGAQQVLGANYAKLIAGRDGTLRQFNPYLGVAAMPSLHVGAHWFFALWARRSARRLFVPLALATALTFVGSLATGWHYAIDGYVGMLLAWAVFVIARRIEPEPPAAPTAEPGAA